MMSSAKSQDSHFEAFRQYVENHNKTFLDQLEHQSEEIKFEEESPTLRTFQVSETDKGAVILKVLTSMVRQPSFQTGNHFKITFPNLAPPKPPISTMIDCHPTENQPGNALLVGYGHYSEYYETDMVAFSAEFDSFLKEKSKVDFTGSHNWQLCLLLVFEIARRIPASDVYRGIPIAAGIQMGLQYPTDEVEDFFGLFHGDEREEVFTRIAKRFYDELSKSGLTDSEIRESFDKKMKAYDVSMAEVKCPSPPIEEGMRKLTVKES